MDPTADILFRRQVAIAGGATLFVTRSATWDAEWVEATAAKFGTWGVLDHHQRTEGFVPWPLPADVEEAVSAALGFRVVLAGWEGSPQWPERPGEGDSVRIFFQRKEYPWNCNCTAPTRS